MNTLQNTSTGFTTSTEQEKDQLLWQIARKRASFKISFVTYLFVNCLLIALWYFTSGVGSYFWPIWPFLGWGLGLAFQYFDAYHGFRVFSAETEYEKLKNEFKQ